MLAIPLLPETVYHIYNHANGDENLFRSDENYLYFLKKYAHYIHPIAETYAYCLMPNHFHLMIKIRAEEALMEYKLSNPQGFRNLEGLKVEEFISQQFSNFFNAYTKAYSKMYNRRGTLFIPNFKRKPITDDQYFTRLNAYIHLNPVKHGFCKDILDWQHSSIHSYVSNKSSKLNKTILEQWFGSNEAILNFHKWMLKEYDLYEND